jgi:ferritin-like metal-binding protein YciE
LQQLYREHLEQSREHEEQIRQRIQSCDIKPSAVKDLTMRAGAIGLRQLADIPPNTPVKLAMHFFAFENLKIATYETLCKIAKHAGDNETAELAARILEQEREAAEKVEGTFERSVELMLQAKASKEPEPSISGA